jgi:Na+/H+ antiporter NhaD/arsenite permease-like protein
MSHDQHPEGPNRPVVGAILGIIALFAIAVIADFPLVTGGGHEEPTASQSESSTSEEQPLDEEQPDAPPAYMVAPFVALLLCIAVLPLIPKVEAWWGVNRNKFIIAAGLGLVTLTYYWAVDGPHGVETTLHHAVLNDYIPFIVLLFSLYTISGGIRIECDVPARPAVNTGFLVAGALLASFIGTTGAAMLLIRPLLETNRQRQRVRHTVVFFIFVVCNCGGCLLPIGDPPLFMGYLRGVDFFWTLNLAPEWAFVNGLVIAVYFVLDNVWFYPREEHIDIVRDETQARKLRIFGLGVNGLLLVGVVAAVAFLDSSQTLPFTDWHPWKYLREVVQLLLVLLSLTLGPAESRRRNGFNYHAIVEVAALFIGIFICMQPALQYLRANSEALGLQTARQYFWLTGSLSSVLDNAPTYLVFFEMAWQTGQAPEGMVPVIGGYIDPLLLTGISLGAVFLGSMTYIGNGPNFMVKAIAEQSGIKMPSFFGYVIFWSIPVLGSVFLLTAWLFL